MTKACKVWIFFSCLCCCIWILLVFITQSGISAEVGHLHFDMQESIVAAQGWRDRKQEWRADGTC